MANNSDTQSWQQVCAVDLGTTKITAAYTFRRVQYDITGGQPRTMLPKDNTIVAFFDNNPHYRETSSYCGFFRAPEEQAKRLHFGRSVMDAVHMCVLGWHDVLPFIKLALFDASDAPKHSGFKDIILHLRARLKELAVFPDTKTGTTKEFGIECILGDIFLEVIKEVLEQGSQEADCHIDAAEMKESPLLLRLTVPSTFDESQNQKIRRAMTPALRKASLPGRMVNLELVSEPVAAINGLLLNKIGKRLFKENDTLLVIDAGGGTVDMVILTVDTLTEDANDTRLSEVQAGTGGCLGSALSNRRFVELFEEAIDSELTEQLCDKTNTPLSILLAQLHEGFESAKRRLDSQDSHYLLGCSLLDPRFVTPEKHDQLKAHGFELRSRMINVERRVLVKCFDPLVEGIVDLAKKQRKKYEDKTKKKLEKIIMLGGMSASRYLVQKIQAHFAGVEVVQPRVNCSEIVPIGAVEAIGNLMHKRYPQVSYGFKQDLMWHEDLGRLLQWAQPRPSYDVAFVEGFPPAVDEREFDWHFECNYLDPKVHADQGRRVDDMDPDVCLLVRAIKDRKVWAVDRVRWVIQKNKTVIEDDEFVATIRGSRFIEILCDAPSFVEEVLYASHECDMDEAAVYHSRHGIHPLGTIHADIPDIHQYRWTYSKCATEDAETGEEEEYEAYRVAYIVRTHLKGFYLYWSLEVGPVYQLKPDNTWKCTPDRVFKASGEYQTIFNAYEPKAAGEAKPLPDPDQMDLDGPS